MRASVGQLFNSLRDRIPELKAAIIISAASGVVAHSSPNFSVDAESFAAEYAALFRIARRTAEDTSMGDALEQILISEKAILIARRVGSDDVAVFVCGANEHLGRLRYEIRRLSEQFNFSVT
ncbi:MAG TPA: roadblock/LC7 domain-containing protein [Terriglobia bacterium]|nr:roadblock/LC7 domain-containing protein [Terriglobia bacterium]